MEIKLIDFYKDLTPDYLAQRKDELLEIKQELDNKNYTYIKEKFHKIAGSGGSYGLKIISDISSEIENHCIDGNVNNLVELFMKYEKTLTEIKISFES